MIRSVPAAVGLRCHAPFYQVLEKKHSSCPQGIALASSTWLLSMQCENHQGLLGAWEPQFLLRLFCSINQCLPNRPFLQLRQVSSVTLVLVELCGKGVHRQIDKIRLWTNLMVRASVTHQQLHLSRNCQKCTVALQLEHLVHGQQCLCEISK